MINILSPETIQSTNKAYCMFFGNIAIDDSDKTKLSFFKNSGSGITINSNGEIRVFSDAKEFFKSILSHLHKHSTNADTTVYSANSASNDIAFEYNESTKIFHVNMSIKDILEHRFNMDFIDIKDMIKELTEKYLGLSGITIGFTKL